jgi:hypothetical protein
MIFISSTKRIITLIVDIIAHAAQANASTFTINTTQQGIIIKF